MHCLIRSYTKIMIYFRLRANCWERIFQTTTSLPNWSEDGHPHTQMTITRCAPPHISTRLQSPIRYNAIGTSIAYTSLPTHVSIVAGHHSTQIFYRCGYYRRGLLGFSVLAIFLPENRHSGNSVE